MNVVLNFCLLIIRAHIDCHIIFSQVMSCTQDLLYKFRELSSTSLNTLNDKQVKTLLAHFHSEVQSSYLKEVRAKPKKLKRIKKFNDKSAYKRYVRRGISKSINNIMLQICRDTDEKQQPIPEQQKGKTSGSSNLKLGSSSNFTRKVKNFNKFMHTALITSNHQDLSCSICLQLLICPSLTICGHVFCFQCLDENLLFSNNCPNCRQNIKGSEPICCSLLDQFITNKVELMQTQADLKNHFLDRKYKFLNWKARRHIGLNSLYVGQLVDVRDTESIWCQGAVQKIYHTFDNELNQRVVSSVLIHYNRWHKLYNQIIQMPTNRLAPLYFFSGRIDIPRYNLLQEQDNMRGSVVSGARVQNNQLYFAVRPEEDEDQQEELQSTNSDDEEQQGANLPVNPNRSYFGIIRRRPHDRPINRRQGGLYDYGEQMQNQVPAASISELVQAYMRRINENTFTYSLDQPQSLNIQEQERDEPADRELNGLCKGQNKYSKTQQKQQQLFDFSYQYQSNEHKSNSAFVLKQQQINEYPPPSDNQEQLLQQQE